MAGAMEEAGEELAGGASLEAELICSICLCLYQDPVSLSCGHSFCKLCVQKVLKAQQHSEAPLTCPMCKLCLGPNLELQKNFHLSNIVAAFQATTLKEKQGEGSDKGETEVFSCEYCLDEPQPAVKTCLVCDSSLCQAHLNKHNAKASHQDHTLVEVGVGGEERRCPEHGRLPECYCTFEGEYICVLCSIWGDHKGHEVITMKEGHDKQLAKLWNTVTWLQEHRSALVDTLEDLQRSESQLKSNTNTVSFQLRKLFDETKTEFIQKEKKILNDIQSDEKKQLAEITKVKKETEQRKEEVDQIIQSLHKMSKEEDIFLFLKEFKLAKERIVSQNSSIVRADVVPLHMDQNRTARYQSLIKYSMVELDGILQNVQDKLANQIMWTSTEPN
ncbi:E3 ubiquitin/ISG15 ligase TRIM25-like isoform X1 [Pithys albifrons albifrons]|uniref:E3 ubiquitin/ISG15 ligase TRIM25-like isoform X1 n=1 Tax=Pithys albifrons albifrons TaxID=3385563 RepID=UPI003A5CE7AE